MKKVYRSWSVTLLLVVAALLIPVLLLVPANSSDIIDPWQKVPTRLPHTSHADLMEGPYEDGPAVTRACLKCHEDSAHQVMKTSHWTWESPRTVLPGREEPVVLGKKNALNNFCISLQPNTPRCTSCHAGYGWEDGSFDFKKEDLVDCLVCHDQSGQYVKSLSGIPHEDTDLLVAAKSVGASTRENCGSCHFRGGGGNAVKHGDLDNTLMFPAEHVDVHMGKHNMRCTDCHRAESHLIMGRAISVSADVNNQIACTDCHDRGLHADERINAHVASVACQSCHIPIAAIREPTKMHWDWSAAGKDLPENVHEYLKIKGRFEYAKKIVPEYQWYNGSSDHHVVGDKINTNGVTAITRPIGSIADAKSKIWPFKVHRGEQIFDAGYLTLISPKTYGEGGYWTEFDWDKAARLGSEIIGQPYSGRYGFTKTEMYWPITHMVSPREHALQCIDCHGDSPQVRMNWYALGYDGDPVTHGGRHISNSERENAE